MAPLHSINNRRRAASALVITLIMIILLTVVLVGFVTTSGIERKTVASHYGKVQADLYNNMAVSLAASRIAEGTQSAPNSGGAATRWWASQPGQIASVSVTGGSTTLFNLSSGAAAEVTKDVSVDLNPTALTRSSGLIDDSTTTRLPVKWVYVRQDGTQIVDPAAAPVYDKDASPIVGRYAFWTDDESARINLNTAASSTSPQSQTASHPSRIDLAKIEVEEGFLPAAQAQNIRVLRNTRPFNSVETVKGANGDKIEAMLTESKIALTHLNHSSDLNRFGEPRIVLTTKKSLAGDRPFLDVLKDDSVDPGEVNNLDKEKIEALVHKLYPYFSKTASEWGLVGAANYATKTLEQKFDGDLKWRGATQIILNLIDYVRSVESSRVMILPIRGANVINKFYFHQTSPPDQNSFGINGTLGNARRMHIVEMGIWLADPPTARVDANFPATYTGKLKLRLYLPSSAGGDVDLTATGANVLNILYTLYPAYGTGEISFGGSNFNITAAHVVGGNVISPGQYRTIEAPITIHGKATRPTRVSTRVALRTLRPDTTNDYLSYDLAPVNFGGGNSNDIHCPIDPSTVAEADIKSMSVNDPVINQFRTDWKEGPNTFGTQLQTAANKLGTAVPTTIPQADSNSAGNITDVSVQPPAPKGVGNNPLGIVGSVGDLGKVHTGGKGASLAGTPWRTLRLQARRAPNGTLPDWIFLDLFTAPLVTNGALDTSAVLRPTTDARAGLINLNAKTQPFLPSQMKRTSPLEILIRSVMPATMTKVPETLAENIISQKLATGTLTTGVQFGDDGFKNNGFYAMPGQICEIEGFGDGGEQDEELVRAMLGFISTQGNVFSVFSVGQKVIQLPNGNIKVMSESRTRTMLERQSNGSVKTVSTIELGQY